MIQGAQLFSKGTSHGSTIHDCGKPFKLRSTLSEDRRLPLQGKAARFMGQFEKLIAACRTAARRNARTKLSKFAIGATARANHAGRRASRAVSDRDHACNGAQADRASSVRPASSDRYLLRPPMPSKPLRQGPMPRSRVSDSSQFSHRGIS